MQEKAYPYILYVGKDFMGAAKKSLRLGFLGAFCLAEMLKKLGVDARKLTREEAQSRLDEIGKIKGATISKADVYQNIVKQFFIVASCFFSRRRFGTPVGSIWVTVS